MSSSQSISAKDCEKWLANPSRNPKTSRLIKKDGPVYRKFQATCDQKKMKSPKKSPMKPSKKLSPAIQKIRDEILLRAMNAGDMEMAEIILGKGGNINASAELSDWDNYTPFIVKKILAEEPTKNDVQKVKWALEHGANPNLKMSNGRTPVFGADVNFLKLLEDYGAKLNVQDKYGNTPLHMNYLPAEAVEYLLNQGLNPKHKNKDGDTPLHEHIGNDRQVDAVKVLLKHGANANAKNKKNVTPLGKLVIDDYNDGRPVAMYRALLEAGANPNETSDDYPFPPLHSVRGPEKIQLLLDHGADPNIKGGISNKTPLRAHAHSFFAPEVIPMLLKAGAKLPNYTDNMKPEIRDLIEKERERRKHKSVKFAGKK